MKNFKRPIYCNMFGPGGGGPLGSAIKNNSAGDPVVNTVIREKFAGEEDQTSEFDSRLRVTDDWKYLRYDLSGGTTVVYPNTCRLGNIYVEVATAVAAISIEDNITDIVQIASGTAAGTEITALKGTRVQTSLRIVNASSATGIIIVQYREAELS